jgi:hypothetical protein
VEQLGKSLNLMAALSQGPGKGGTITMHRTFNTLRLFVAATALLLAALAASAAHAQSVKGSGSAETWGGYLTFDVDAHTSNKGLVGGTIKLNVTEVFGGGEGGSYATYQKLSYQVKAISVVGVQATVWAKGTDKTLHEFIFIDNGAARSSPITLAGPSGGSATSVASPTETSS